MPDTPSPSVAASEPTYDYQRYAILYVDDEEISLKYFSRAYGNRFRVLTAVNARDGLRVLEENLDTIGLLITDQKMPGEQGVWLLDQARQRRPHIIRILATAYSDMNAAIDAVNDGAIYKYVTKPWDPPQLESTLRRGLEFFMVQKERDQLLREKLTALHDMMMADRIVSLGLLAAGLSHHIRNWLVPVKTFLELLPQKLSEAGLDPNRLAASSFWGDYHKNAQGQVERINNLLKELWTASEKPPGSFGDQVDLKTVLEEAMEKLRGAADTKKVVLRNTVPPGLPRLTVDRAMFARLFELLLKDEVANLPTGSEVVVSVASDATSSEAITVLISDNGPRVAPDMLRVLFDPFVPRNDDPSEYGINLMACYFLVHHHGGKIEVSQHESSGTEFRLTFPLIARSPGLHNTDEQQKKIALNNLLWNSLLSASAGSER